MPKALRLQNAMEVEDYINYSEESSDAEEDESLQAHRVTHSEALKALNIVSHYFL
jgi:hypothetical protein